jgi:uncharacterized protein
MLFALPCGVVVGIALGLTGGGGSIFALPLLLFVLGLPLRESVAVSLSVVGITALYGAALQWRRVLWGAGAVLGLGGVAAAPFGAAIGAHLPDALVIVLFAALMVVIGLRMRRGRPTTAEIPLSPIACQRAPDGKLQFSWSCAAKLAVAGAITGLLSGTFGVGGGFLIAPALLAVTCMPLDRVLATSLVGIALISASGLAANLALSGPLPLNLSALFLAGAIIGMTAGTALKSRLPDSALRLTFSLTVIAVATWMIAQTTWDFFVAR